MRMRVLSDLETCLLSVLLEPLAYNRCLVKIKEMMHFLEWACLPATGLPGIEFLLSFDLW